MAEQTEQDRAARLARIREGVEATRKVVYEGRGRLSPDEFEGQDLVFLLAEVDRLAGERDRAREALEAADEAFDLMDYEGLRVRRVPPGSVPEDAEVRALGERVGYGAVMDACARLWWQVDEGRGGSFIIGGAVATTGAAARAVKKALRALAAGGEPGEGK